MANEKRTPSKKADVKAEAPKKKAGKDGKQKKNPFKSIGSFFKSVRSEGKKVVWPGAKETLKNALVVLIVVVIAGVAIYAVDSVLSLGMRGLKSLSDNTSVSDTVNEDTSDTTEAEADTTAAADDTTAASDTTAAA